LVDGVVLAEEIARSPSVKDALAGYDKRRRPLASRVQRMAEMLQRLCGIEGVTALRLRDALLAGLARFPRFNDEVIRRALAPEVRAVRSASLCRPHAGQGRPEVDDEGMKALVTLGAPLTGHMKIRLRACEQTAAPSLSTDVPLGGGRTTRLLPPTCTPLPEPLVSLTDTSWRFSAPDGEEEPVGGDHQGQPGAAEQPGEDHVGEPVVAQEHPA